MQGSDKNKKMFIEKREFLFQIGITVFMLLGVVVKELSWLFWMGAFLCALCWIGFVHQAKLRQEKENEKKDDKL